MSVRDKCKELRKDKHTILKKGECIFMDSREKLVLEKEEVEEIDRSLKALDNLHKDKLVSIPLSEWVRIWSGELE